MKIKCMSALNLAPKLFCTVALSAFLVACGGGGSGDGADDGTIAGTDAEGTNTGFGDIDLDPNATTDNGLTDGELIDGELVEGPDRFIDAEGNNIIDENDICKGLGGSDPDSGNQAWNDNCWLREDINPDIPQTVKSPFYDSTYVQGVQRILYCRGHAGVVDSVDAFSDGKFGPKTKEAVIKFQEAEGIPADGIVGGQTWGKLQLLVETEDRGVDSTFIGDASDLDYHVFGVQAPLAENSEIDCRQVINFFGRLQIQTDLVDGDRYAGWELAKKAGVNDRGTFSIDPVE